MFTNEIATLYDDDCILDNGEAIKIKIKVIKGIPNINTEKGCVLLLGVSGLIK